MKEANIKIDLKNLNWYFIKGEKDENFQLIKNYLDGDLTIRTINRLIKFISDTELSLFTPEEIVCRYLGTLDYSPLSHEVVNNMFSDGLLNFIADDETLYFSNFAYANGSLLTPNEENNILEIENVITCLVCLKREFVTFCFLDDAHKEFFYD